MPPASEEPPAVPHPAPGARPRAPTTQVPGAPRPAPGAPPPHADDAGSRRPAPVHLACPRTGFGRLNTALPPAAALLLAAQVFVGPFAGNEHPPVTHQVCPPPSLPFLLGKIEHPNPNSN